MAPRAARASRRSAILGAAFALAAAAPGAAAAAAEFHRYIIVGAGPGGLQLAHYFETAGRDYLVLDKASVPASFFVKFPRWRQLISVNKVYTGQDALDFQMRHDWNSLLSEPSTSSADALGDAFDRVAVPCLRAGGGGGELLVDVNATCWAADYSSTDARFRGSAVPPGLRFGDYASEYYPHADRLVEYVAGWANGSAPRGAITGAQSPFAAAAARVPLNVQYGVTIERVERPAGFAAGGGGGGADGSGARFRITAAGGRRVWECRTLIWAAGLQKLNRADGINIAGSVSNYWTHSTNVSEYVNKTVLILGRGNAAFEVANHVLGVTATTHVVGRETGRVRLAVETHYPGDVRRIHSNLLESYLLKSQDGLAELPQRALEVAYDNATDSWNVTDRSAACRRDAYGRGLERCFFRKPYDKIISCPGWHFDTAPFAPEVRPAMAAHGKHPALAPGFGSANVSGLYFAGTLAHAMDYRKSSGGFIHGFRYTARALHRHLEEVEEMAGSLAAIPPARRGRTPFPAAAAAAVDAGGAAAPLPPLTPRVEGAGWPRRHLPGSLRALASALLRRINLAAGPYQMFGSIADVFVLPALAADAADGFVEVGPRAPFEDPSSFYDAAVPDDTILQIAPTPFPTAVPPARRGDLAAAAGLAAAAAAHAAQRASEAAVSRALAGAMFEEVPLPLIPSKAPLWAAQTAAALRAAGAAGLAAPAASGRGSEWAPSPDGAGAAALLGGAEWITLTLEFGSPQHVASAADWWRARVRDPDAPEIRLRERAEWQRDPFSLLRANVSLWEPERSHFLHPVLRYFHTGLAPAPNASSPPPPVAEAHIIEDFHASWTHYAAHVLPLGRFLQDVAARRLAATRVAAGAAIEAAVLGAASGAPAGGEALRVAARRAVRGALWSTQRELTAHGNAIRNSMMQPHATLWFGGAPIIGGEAWFNQLSVNATDALLYTGPQLLVVHYVDPYPVAPSAEEEAAVAAIKDIVRASNAEGTGGHTKGPEVAALAATEPVLRTEEERAAHATNVAFLKRWYARISLTLPRVPLITVNARKPMARIHAENYGVNKIPLFRIYDSWRGQTDSPGNDFDAAIARLTTLADEHAAAAAAIARGDTSMLFPGTSLADVHRYQGIVLDEGGEGGGGGGMAGGFDAAAAARGGAGARREPARAEAPRPRGGPAAARRARAPGGGAPPPQPPPQAPRPAPMGGAARGAPAPPPPPPPPRAAAPVDAVRSAASEEAALWDAWDSAAAPPVRARGESL